MAKIFFMRHAQSQANTAGIWQGQRYDTGLTDMGQLQAKTTAETLLFQDIKIVWSSPLKRAIETAQIAAQVLGLRVSLDSRLAETDHGDWSFLSDDQIKTRWPSQFHLWFTRPSLVRFPGGEDFAAQTAPRVISWWESLDKTRNTLVVTHENIIQILAVHLARQSLDDIWSHRITNGSVLEYSYA